MQCFFSAYISLNHHEIKFAATSGEMSMSSLIFYIFSFIFVIMMLMLCTRALMQCSEPDSTDDALAPAMIASLMLQQQNQTASVTAAAVGEVTATPSYTPDPSTYTQDIPSYSAPACAPSDTSLCA